MQKAKQPQQKMKQNEHNTWLNLSVKTFSAEPNLQFFRKTSYNLEGCSGFKFHLFSTRDILRVVERK